MSRDMNERKWLKIVNEMPEMGMARILATHCHFGYYEKNNLGLHLSVDHSHLATSASVERLAKYLDAVFGRLISLTIWNKDNLDLELLGTWKPIDHQSISQTTKH